MPRSTKQKTTFTPKSAPSPTPASRSIPAPTPTPTPLHVPVQSQSQSQNQNHSMFDTMKQGFSFGIGSAIAHRIFNPSPHKNESNPRDKNEINPRDKNEVINEPKLTTEKMYELYNICLEKNDNNIDCNIILQNNNI